MTAARTEVDRVRRGDEVVAPFRADTTSARSETDAAAFRQIAAALATDAPDSEAARQHAGEAAAALVSWAASGAQGLAAVLRPDPVDRGSVTWTVACYRLGDLTPTALRDFVSVAEAVPALACCPDAAHVAAELIASDATGLRWTAMVRTADSVRFQLLSPDTGSGATSLDADGLDAAQRRWQAQLARWETDPYETVHVAAESPGRGEAERILQALGALDRQIDGLIVAQHVGSRLESLERRVADLQSQFQLRAWRPPTIAEWLFAAYVRGAAAAQSARLAGSRVRSRLVAPRSRSALPAHDTRTA